MNRPTPGRRTRAVYFFCQAIATAAWWLVVATSPGWRAWFSFGDDEGLLWQFLPADLVFWCAGSLAVGCGEWLRASWTSTLRLVLCGGMGCSVLHSLALATLTGAGWTGVFLMLPALGMTVWLTWIATCFRS